jgi:hypothetical protein
MLARPWWMLALLVLAESQTALAQVSPRDDVQWEVRRLPYDGGPIRPGAQLQGSANGALIGAGAGVFLLSYAVGLIALDARGPEVAIPVVGPWLGAFGALSNTAWQDLFSPMLIVTGITQLAGLAMLVAGLLTPHYHLVYDAPAGERSPFEVSRVDLLPGAAGAELGLTLRVEAF